MPELLCTELDIVDKVPQLWNSMDGEYSPRSFIDILNVILESDGHIRSSLRQLYGADLTSGISPWAKVPEANSRPANSGSGVLSPWITVAATAITELWKMTFSSATAVTVTAGISGSQGSGTVSVDFTSTNSYITIPAANWGGTPASGDIFYIRVYDVEAAVMGLSSAWAAHMLLDNLYTEEIPNRSDMAKAYGDMVERLLKSYTNDNSPYELETGKTVRDLDPIPIPGQMVISDTGEDIGVYEDWEFAISSGDAAHDF